MKIRVGIEKTKAKLTHALEAVNGKALTFIVTSGSDIAQLADRAETYLDKYKISRRDRIGTKLVFRPAGPTANAYRFKAVSTEVELSPGGSGWYLTAVSRAPVYPRSSERFSITITDRALCNLIKRVLQAFGGCTLPPAIIAEATAQLAPQPLRPKSINE